ncbi:MAG: aminoglycoside phosphotransferase family protein [Candidatus Wallbacteria bacterium]|nr:aminoglycoside phosphotransferase family protein [Candidatus Wallbacteria bacterium]
MENKTLPETLTSEEYHVLLANDRVLSNAAVAIAAGHGIKPRKAFRFPKKGSTVFCVNDAIVIKLFAPIHIDSFERERAFLKVMSRFIPDAIPRMLVSGLMGSWGYVVMNRLPGYPLDEVWSSIKSPERSALIRELGELTAQMHDVPPGELPELMIDWPGFLRTQKTNCRICQEHLGLSPEWLERIDPFLDQVDALLPPAGPVILHTELMRQHVFVMEHRGRWKISGIIDFEPAMIGDRDYEFASVGVFVSCGDSELLKSFFHGYGLPEDEPDRMRVMKMLLLHKYCNLPWFMKEVPAGDAQSMQDLACAWFGAAL